MKKTYHHENLRGALLDAGRTFIADNGHDGLSVRALAQAAGVSPGAPYHHFRDRDSLLVALALEGFESLNVEGQAIMEGSLGARERLYALGHALLRFCAEQPRLFKLMYESELTQPTIKPELAEAQRFGFDLVTRALRDAAPNFGPDELRTRALAYWATLYGFAALTGRGLLRSYVLAETPDEMARDVIVRQAIGDLGAK